jgi:hypothetical protein
MNRGLTQMDADGEKVNTFFATDYTDITDVFQSRNMHLLSVASVVSVVN